MKFSILFCITFLLYGILPAFADEQESLTLADILLSEQTENIIIVPDDVVAVEIPRPIFPSLNSDSDIILSTNHDEPIEILPLVSENGIASNSLKEFEFDNDVDGKKSTDASEGLLTLESIQIKDNQDENNQVIATTGQFTLGLSNGVSENTTKPVNPERTALDMAGISISSSIARRVMISDLVILAVWQMLDDDSVQENFASDDSRESGAQILPSGQYEVDKSFSVCALVADTLSDKVFASVNIMYPNNINFKNNDKEQLWGQLKNSFYLNEIDQKKAETLFCEQIRNKNNNLPIWNKAGIEGSAYDYNQICGQDGLLKMNSAKIYCAKTTLAYKDPAGLYEINYSLSDDFGTKKEFKTNLKYLELTMFENDFFDVQYGQTDLNEWKTLKGDAIWGSAKAPTVRNIGNTRLKIKLKQDDFGFGKSGMNWNLLYRARVGQEAIFSEYLPEQTVILNNILDLGEISNIDFSVYVNNFPENNSIKQIWDGEILLLAEKEEF